VVTLGQLRWRLARKLVGPFVTLPEREGVWIVMKNADASTATTVEADKFRLKTASSLNPVRFASAGTADEIVAGFARYQPSRRTGRFVGTVKYR
jgi:hypothetical protein